MRSGCGARVTTASMGVVSPRDPGNERAEEDPVRPHQTVENESLQQVGVAAWLRGDEIQNRTGYTCGEPDDADDHPNPFPTEQESGHSPHFSGRHTKRVSDRSADLS